MIMGGFIDEVDCAQMKQVASEVPLTLTYFGEKTQEGYHKAYSQIAQVLDEKKQYKFLHSDDLECAKELGVEEFPAVVFHRHHDPTPATTTDTEFNALIRFTMKNALPDVVEFDDTNIGELLNAGLPVVIMLRNPEKHDDNQDFMKHFKAAAKDLREDASFSTSYIKEGLQERLADLADVTEADLPHMMILDPQQRKFKY